MRSFFHSASRPRFWPSPNVYSLKRHPPPFHRRELESYHRPMKFSFQANSLQYRPPRKLFPFKRSYYPNYRSWTIIVDFWNERISSRLENYYYYSILVTFIWFDNIYLPSTHLENVNKTILTRWVFLSRIRSTSSTRVVIKRNIIFNVFAGI